jgi:hypothetical protein
VKRVVLLGCVALACTLEGDGRRISKSRFIMEYFDAIEVFDSFETDVVVDDTLQVGIGTAVKVSGEGNVLDRLFIGVHAEQTLSAGVDPNNLTSLTLAPTLGVRIPVLVKLYADDRTITTVTGGTGEILVEAHDRAVVSMGGAEAASLTVEVSDDAAVTLAGAGPALKISTTGAASVDAQGFRADGVTVDAQGSGTVVVCSVADPVVIGDGAVERRCD